MEYQIINENTPIEEYDGILYKRDDLFQPFGMHGTNGGKVRQAISLIKTNLENIKENFGGTIVTHTQVHSTTGTILAQVCKFYGLKCIICVGGSSSKTLYNHHMMVLARHWGADIRNVCGTGMHGPVLSRMRDLAEKENAFNAVFSDNVDKFPKCILDTTTEQVMNIPDYLENLVIPVGSGIQMAAILRGLVKYEKSVKNIYGVCIGPDRSKKIDYYVNPLEYPIYDYQMIPLKTQYGKGEREFFGGGLMDELYEAKAHKWMMENINTSEKTLFWIVGRRLTKEEVYENYDLTLP
jgi:cysteine synthase